MHNLFSGQSTREELEAVLALNDGANEDGRTSETEPNRPSDPANRDELGRFGTGNRVGSSKPKGIVSYIRERTQDYKTLIDALVTIHLGKPLYGSKPTLKDSIDCTIELLNRGIGKPTQQVYHTSDEETKQLMADRARLRVLEAERKAITRKPVIEHEPTKSISSIQAMRDREGAKG